MNVQAGVPDTGVGLGTLVDDYYLEGLVIASQDARNAGIKLLRPFSSRNQNRNLHWLVGLLLIVPIDHRMHPRTSLSHLSIPANGRRIIPYPKPLNMLGCRRCDARLPENRTLDGRVLK